MDQKVRSPVNPCTSHLELLAIDLTGPCSAAHSVASLDEQNLEAGYTRVSSGHQSSVPCSDNNKVESGRLGLGEGGGRRNGALGGQATHELAVFLVVKAILGACERHLGR